MGRAGEGTRGVLALLGAMAAWYLSLWQALTSALGWVVHQAAVEPVRRVPAGAEEVQRLTELYQEARYSEGGVVAEQAALARRASEAVRRALASRR